METVEYISEEDPTEFGLRRHGPESYGAQIYPTIDIHKPYQSHRNPKPVRAVATFHNQLNTLLPLITHSRVKFTYMILW